MKMIPQAMDKDPTIPEVITIELKKGKSYRQKNATTNATGRRASLPTLPSGFETDGTELKPSSTRRRSTMPQVTQEMKDSLPPLHELASLLMPPSSASKRIPETKKFETTSDNVDSLIRHGQDSLK